MDQDYGREEWQEDEGAARAEALRLIAVVRETGAEVLDLSDLTALTALPKEIATLTNLRGLFAGDRTADGKVTPFSGFRLRDIAALSGMVGLTSLDLSDTQVSDIAALSGMAGLTSLNLSGTPVSDIAALSGLVGLTSLNLSNTRLSDIAALSGLVGLTSLDLSRTPVSDIAALSGMVGLTSLNLSNTRVSDISVILRIPAFAAERAEYLNFQNTPAADPDRDRRMYMLSRLDGRRCAIETVQYLKGTHPDFRDPPGGAAPLPLTERLMLASPVGFDVQDDQLSATNPGAPERLAPKELALRVIALRTHVAMLLADAEAQQVDRRVVARLAAFAAPLRMDEPTYILLDGPMSFLRGGLADTYVTDALDKGFVEGWLQLVTMHDELRPLLLPPVEADTLPPLSPAATPDEGIRLTDQAISAAEAAEGPGGTDESVAATFRSIRDYFEMAKSGVVSGATALAKGFRALGGAVAWLVRLGGPTAGIATWLASQNGQAFVGVIRTLWDALKGFFVG